MNKHSKSLLLSIIVHSLLLASVFYAYSEVVSTKTEQQEKRVCLQLGCIKESVKKPQKPQKIKKEKPKTTKPHPPKKRIKKPEKPKEIVKKTVQKTIPLPKKKVLEKKPTESIKKTKKEEVLEKEVVKEQKCEEKVEVSPQNTTDTQMQQKQNQPQVSKESQYINRHLRAISKLLQENLYYPRRARKRGIEGKVIVKFILQTDAKVTDIEIISSKSTILSRGATKTLQKLSGMFPRPDEELILTVPISYSLD